MTAASVQRDHGGTDVLRIGVRGPNLQLLSTLDLLERELEACGGRSVEWIHLEAGALELGAMLDAGVVDVGASSPTPAIGFQASGVDLCYLGVTAASSAFAWGFGGLCVLAESDLFDISDLRGHRLALNEGWWHTALVAQQLVRAGMTFSDLDLVVPRADAAEGLRGGVADAWVAQGLEFAAIAGNPDFRVLHRSNQIATARSLVIGRRSMLNDEEAIVALIRSFARLVDYYECSRAEAVARLGKFRGISGADYARMIGERPFGLQRPDAAFVALQQATADALVRTGWLPREVRIEQAVPSRLEELYRAAA